MKLLELFEGLFKKEYPIIKNPKKAKAAIERVGDYSGLSESLLFEFLEPKKPDNIKKSTITKSGVQGSKLKINQIQFHTAKGNNVKIHLKPSIVNDQKSINVSFFVNDTMDDNASKIKEGDTTILDHDIIPHVFYSMFKYADNAKINHITFEAITSLGDTKKIKNIPLSKPLTELNNAIDKLYNKLNHTIITKEMIQQEKDRVNALYQKLNKPLVDDVIVINVDVLKTLLQQLKSFVNGKEVNADNLLQILVPFNSISSAIEDNKKGITYWVEFSNLQIAIDEYRKTLRSYSIEGLSVTKNRRFSIYSKMLSKYYPNWDVETYGKSFELTRK
jgi:hypothetical protein